MPDFRKDKAFMEKCAKAYRTRISSTNPLERLIGEIKRRTDVVGIFPKEAAIVRLVGALQLEQNDGWAVGRPISASRPSPPSGVLTSSRCPLLHTPRDMIPVRLGANGYRASDIGTPTLPDALLAGLPRPRTEPWPRQEQPGVGLAASRA